MLVYLSVLAEQLLHRFSSVSGVSWWSLQESTSQSGHIYQGFFCKLCALLFKNHDKDLEAELTAFKKQNARLLLEQQVAALAVDVHRMTAAELSSIRNNLR